MQTFVYAIPNDSGRARFYAKRGAASWPSATSRTIIAFYDENNFQIVKDRHGDFYEWIKQQHHSVVPNHIDMPLPADAFRNVQTYRFTSSGDLMAFRLRWDWDWLKTQCQTVRQDTPWPS